MALIWRVSGSVTWNNGPVAYDENYEVSTFEWLLEVHSSLLKTKTMCVCMDVCVFVSSLWRLITEKWRELGW